MDQTRDSCPRNVIEYISEQPLVQGTKLAAGFDLRMTGVKDWGHKGNNTVHAKLLTGVRLNMMLFELPLVAFGILRGSTSFKYPIRQTNAMAIIDQDYQGEIMIPVAFPGGFDIMQLKGERVAQVLFVPCYSFGMPGASTYAPTNIARFGAQLVKVDTFSSPPTERGSGAFGSTGAT